MQFNPLSIAKFVVSGVVGLGAGKIVKSIIMNNMDTPETIVEKVTMISGAWVLSGIVTTASKKYTDEAIDEVVKNVGPVIKKMKVSAKLKKINAGQSTWEDEGLKREDFTMTSDGTFIVRETVEETTDAK